jgi:hypothetical protein
MKNPRECGRRRRACERNIPPHIHHSRRYALSAVACDRSQVNNSADRIRFPTLDLSRALILGAVAPGFAE